MTPKRIDSPEKAVAEVSDGAVVMIGGFGRSGVPEALTDALSARRVRGLTVISNNAGTGETGIARLLREGCIKKIICSYPRPAESGVFKDLYDAGMLELELVPQGTLAERIRVGGAGLGGFLTLTGVGTELAEGKQVMELGAHKYILELPLRADFALVKAHKVDPWGNLTYRKAARNFNPIMAMAAKLTIVQAWEAVPLGSLDPECVITPGVYVDRYCINN
ncbi:MAG: 3-oxoacid CoA-transferase subunit A [Rhodospirillales bacterium]